MRASFNAGFSGGVFIRRLLLICLLIAICVGPSLLSSPHAQASTAESGTITQYTVWTTAQSPYVVSNLTIAQGATLSIDPGVIVKFQNSSSGISVSGTLNASDVVFTSIKDDNHGGDTNGDGGATLPAAGDWGTIGFASGGSGTINGCVILFGGANSAYEIWLGSSPTIENSVIGSSQGGGAFLAAGNPAFTGDTFSNNGGMGLDSMAVISTLSGNTFTGNSGVAVELPASIGSGVNNNTYSGNTNDGMYLSGDVTAQSDWSGTNKPYVVEGDNNNKDLEVNAPLTIESGSVVKFDASPTSYTHLDGLHVNSSLNANNVVFTSYNDDNHGGDTNGDHGATLPQGGDWGSIVFNPGSSGSLSGCTVLFGGGAGAGEMAVNSASPTIISSTFASAKYDGATIASNSNPAISGSSFANNGAMGLDSATPLSTFSGNTFTSNGDVAVQMPANIGTGVNNNTYSGNMTNAMRLTGWVTSSSDWAETNSPYVLQGDNNYKVVNVNAPLTIESGAVVKFQAMTPSYTYEESLEINSSISATGAVFTSYYDDNHGGDTDRDHGATLPQAGNWGSIVFNPGSSGSLSGCTVLFGGGTGAAEITVNSASPTIANSVIASSKSGGAYIINTSNPAISGSSFANNGGVGLNSSAALSTLSGNTFTANGDVAVEIPANIGTGVNSNSYGGNKVNAMYLTGDVNAPSTWAGSNAPYVLNNTVNVDSPLTIQSGAVVKLGQPYQTGINVNKQLIATGTVFTSLNDDAHGGDINNDGGATSPQPGNWGSIVFNPGSSGSLSGCTVLFGGGTGAAEITVNSASPTIANSVIASSKSGGAYIINTSNPAISGSSFANNGGVGLDSLAVLSTLSGNTFTANGDVAVEIPANIGTGVNNNTYSGNKYNAMLLTGWVTSNSDWEANNSPYVLQGDNTYKLVDVNAPLTIESGSVVKFDASPSSYSNQDGLDVNSSLTANNVVFTSFKDDANGGDTNGDGSLTAPQPGDWGSIIFNPGSSGSLSGCAILYGGGTGDGEITANSASPAITNSTIAYAKYDGADLINTSNSAISGDTFANNGAMGLDSMWALSTLSGNTFTANGDVAVEMPANIGTGVNNNTYSGNKYNGMRLTGDITGSSDWASTNSPYIVQGDNNNKDLEVDAPLTIESGSVVKFDASPTSYTNEDGLNVNSSLNANNVVFTSYHDDSYAGDTNGDRGATSPEPGDWNGIIYAAGSTGAISNCVIRYGGGVTNGEFYINSSPQLTGNDISYSLTAGITVGADGSPLIHYNDIYANSLGVVNYGGANLDVTYNYWGSKHGPKPYGFGNGLAGLLTVIPWSGIPYTQSGALYQSKLGMADYCAVCGDPINTATGAFVYQHTDVKVPTKGVPLEFDRTYNSNDASDGDLGFGWSYNWQISVNPLANGNVTVLRGDGSQDVFTLNPDGSYSPPSLGVHDTLVRNADGTFKLTTKDQITYNFDLNNDLASEVSETGQSTTFAYNSNLQLTTITEPAGRTLSLAHDAVTGRITQITDPNGKTIAFAYSAAGDLTSVTDQNSGTTKFAYDSNHHIIGVTDADNHTQANNTYDATGKVTSQTDAEGKLITFTYDATSNVTTMTRQMDPNDHSKDQTTTFYYDSQYRLIKETDPYGKSTTYTYDAAGDRDTVTDRRGTITKQLYDPSGNVTDIYKAYGLPGQEHTSFTYNAKNHPLSKTDPLGHTTTYTYDSSGSYLMQVAYPTLTSYDAVQSSYTETFTYNPDGTRASFTDKNGNTTGYGYDQYGNLSAQYKNTNRSPADQVTLAYAYDPMGRKTGATDANGHTTTLVYDNLGNLTSQTKQVSDPGTGQLVDVTTQTSYDAAGNKTQVIDADGNSTTYSYTPMNRLSQVTDALGGIVQYSYDAAGNKTGTKDRNGNWTHFAFDLNNRMVSATDPENNVTTYTYDEEGNQLSVKDPLGNTSTKTYDGIGRVTTSSVPDVGGATRTTSFTYDAADNLLSTTDPLSHVTTNAYDELGRLKSVTDPLGNISYTAYDGMDNRVKTKDPKGNVTSFAFSPNNWLITVNDPAGGVTSYQYDKAGNRTQQTDANGHVTLYSYDELNRLKEEKVDAGGGSFLLDRSYTYDKTGHVLADTTGDGTVTNTYDGDYNLTAVTDRKGNTFSYTYDANGNQLTAKDNGANKTVTFTYSSRSELATSNDATGGNESYTYDGTGNLSQRQDSISGQNFTTSYAYTPRDQLQSVIKGADATSYTFDPAGDLATKTYGNGVTSSYSYDADSRLTGLQATKGGTTLQSYSQTYDANSNITSLTEPAGTDSYTYDALNRETSENLAAYGNITYGYDAAGNRLSKTQPAQTGGPVLSLAMTKVYWASSSDYQNHLLSIDYSVKDNGPGTAHQSAVTGSTATNGVYLSTGVPIGLGDIAQGASAPLTLKYYIPPGVSRFSATVYAECQDGNGAVYSFPTDRTTYSYNQANQLTSSYDQQAVTTSYSYNANGALTQQSNPQATTSYSYNGLDKLTQVTTPATTVGYSYDALGRRITRTDTNGTINYQLDGKSDLTDFETDGNGKMTGAYLRGADGLISQTDYTGQSPVTSYYLYNPHGDTSATTDQNGNVTGTYRYDSFGNPIGTNNLTDAYAGKWQRNTDDATGLIKMGAREYDPTLGRFTSADPKSGELTAPLMRNRYPYALNNPNTWYDLSGLYPGESYVDAAVGTWNDWRQGGVSALANDYWQGYSSMPTWAQYTDTGVILGGMTFLDLYSMGALTPVQGNYASELLSGEEGAIGCSEGSFGDRGFNPFEGKSAEEIDGMFRTKGFIPMGPDPVSGQGSYINPITGRMYYIDSGGVYGKVYEGPHIDVHRLPDSIFPKRKFPYGG